MSVQKFVTLNGHWIGSAKIPIAVRNHSKKNMSGGEIMILDTPPLKKLTKTI